MTAPYIPSIKGYTNLTPLLVSCHNGRLKERSFKEREINIRDAKGRNALYWAIYHKNSENIEYLLRKRICLKVAPKLHALFWAIECNSICAIELLTAHGLDANAIKKSGCGTSPLAYAASMGRLEICKILLLRGAEPYAVDSHFRTPSDHARAKGYDLVANVIETWGRDMPIFAEGGVR